MSKIILYGIAGESANFKACRYFIVPDEHVSIQGIRGGAMNMRELDSNIEKVYALDNHYGLKSAYLNSFRATRNDKHSFEACIAFKDILEREGVEV